jgi:hypothetical protein
MASVSSSAFWTTEANAVVAPIHPQAMPAILTTPEEVDQRGAQPERAHADRKAGRSAMRKGSASGAAHGQRAPVSWAKISVADFGGTGVSDCAVGNTARDTSGSTLVGESRGKGLVGTLADRASAGRGGVGDGCTKL